MKRYAMQHLIEWKEDPGHLPMIIRGARQVGKTWLMKEFGRTEFEKYAYINFDRNSRMKQLFSGDFDVDRILRGLSIERQSSLRKLQASDGAQFQTGCADILVQRGLGTGWADPMHI